MNLHPRRQSPTTFLHHGVRHGDRVVKPLQDARDLAASSAIKQLLFDTVGLSGIAKVVLQFAGGVVHHGNSVPAQQFHVSALGIARQFGGLATDKRPISSSFMDRYNLASLP